MVTEGTPEQNRRTLLKSIGAASVLGIAGCTSSQSNDSTEPGGGAPGSDGGPSDRAPASFAIGGNDIPGKMSLDGVAPRTTLPLSKILNEEAQDLFNLNLAIEAQLCNEQACIPKIVNNNIQAANFSIENSTSQWPSNVLWVLPYTFRSGLELAHVWTKAKSWENYWVPFGRRHGVIPITSATFGARQIYIGSNKQKEIGNKRLSTPSDIQGFDIRRTKSPAAALILEEWGANPVDVSWGDTLQGMRSGVVDGMESATGASLAFGMGDSIGQIIKNNWSIAGEVLWANVDWLKGLSDEQRNALASATKEASENVIHMYRDHMLNDIGEQQPPPEGSRLAELDIMVTAPSESEMEQWKEPVDPQKNPKKYEDIIGGSNIGGKEFYDYLYNAARSDEVPTNYEDFAPQSWWDKHLDDI